MKATQSKDRIKILAMFFSVAMLLSGATLSAHAAKQNLTNTSMPVEIPLVMGYANGKQVFYITTEASDRDVANHLTDLLDFKVTYAPAIKDTPKDALAKIYEFTNGIEGPGPAGFQPNVADSQPGDPKYSPAWSVQHVTWKDTSSARELTSEDEILAAQTAGELTVGETGVIVNCPFIQWDGGALPIRENKDLTDDTPYGGGQVLDIDTENMVVTFVAHRGFAPDGSTIYYIATDASTKDVADMLGVIQVEKLGKTLVSSAASDLYVFTNGITGTGPAGFQASIGSTNAGDEFYSPFWRIQTVTWKNPDQAQFLTMASEISEIGSKGDLSTAVGGFIVNCPFLDMSASMNKMMDNKMDKNTMDEKMNYTMNEKMTDKSTEYAMTPTQQMKQGVEPRQVQCAEDLQLLIKISNGDAVCVSENTASALMERGYATQP